VRNR